MSETAFGSPDDRGMARAGCAGAPGPVPADDGGVARVLGSITIACRADKVAAARRFVAATLGDHPRLDAALLLTSEVVTNSVIHTRSAAVTLVVAEIPGGLRFEVTDDGGDTVPVVPGGCELRESGRGVFLIESLSVRCGFHVDADGLTYWFEL